jgi:hypothetical protein
MLITQRHNSIKKIFDTNFWENFWHNNLDLKNAILMNLTWFWVTHCQSQVYLSCHIPKWFKNWDNLFFNTLIKLYFVQHFSNFIRLCIIQRILCLFAPDLFLTEVPFNPFS